jgi:hypothetical protein
MDRKRTVVHVLQAVEASHLGARRHGHVAVTGRRGRERRCVVGTLLALGLGL